MFINERDVVLDVINFVERFNAFQLHRMSTNLNLNYHQEGRMLRQDHVVFSH